MIHYHFGDKKFGVEIKKAFENVLNRELKDNIHNEFKNPETLFFVEDGSGLRKTTDKMLINLIVTHPDSEEIKVVIENVFERGCEITHVKSGDVYRVDSVTDNGYTITDRNGQQSYLMKGSDQLKCFKKKDEKVEPRFSQGEMIFDDANNVYYIEFVDTAKQQYKVMRFKSGDVRNILSATIETIPFNVMHSKRIKI